MTSPIFPPLLRPIETTSELPLAKCGSSIRQKNHHTSVEGFRDIQELRYLGFVQFYKEWKRSSWLVSALTWTLDLVPAAPCSSFSSSVGLFFVVQHSDDIKIRIVLILSSVSVFQSMELFLFFHTCSDAVNVSTG